MTPNQICPVCSNLFLTTASVGSGTWGYRVDCPVCGRFEIDREADDDFLDPKSPFGVELTAVDRAHLAHKIQAAVTAGPSGLPRLNSDFLERYIKEGCPGPSPALQVSNAIKFIGDQITLSGERIESLPDNFFIIMGAPSKRFSYDLLLELEANNLITGIKALVDENEFSLQSIGLTLSGWNEYEKERSGKIAGRYGFLALKFGDVELESLTKDIIKPALKSALNFDVFDMRDVARAGVIDNIMRAQIRDAAFVIVDLTHDNSGAYWEAGYAEGLGKPVIYICEKEKFDLAKTHFDTNHCTTVVWSSSSRDEFSKQLVATLRRSLNLF